MDWNKIALEIRKGNTVLVLGPDAIPFYPARKDAAQSLVDETTFSRLTRKDIRERLNGQISYFYKRDNLFLFKDARAKRDAMEIVEECIHHRNWLPDAELLRKIVAMPFPIVLNLNPDKYLFEAFLKYFREPMFDYFSIRNKSGHVNFDKKPDTKESPLIYNLCGSVMDDLDSVVLDHFDLFKFMQKLLNDEGVPRLLTDSLHTANRFILLGFELERWYFQMFLHYLNRLDGPFDNINQNFPILSNVSEDSREFVMKQFNIEHFAASRADFDLLYQACERENMLRKINDPASPVELQIRMLVAQNKIAEALDTLKNHLDDTEMKQIDLPFLRSRQADWLEKSQKKLATAEHLDVEINRIRNTILTYAHQI